MAYELNQIELESDPRTEANEEATTWIAPDFDEQSACAEICAYVFTD